MTVTSSNHLAILQVWEDTPWQVSSWTAYFQFWIFSMVSSSPLALAVGSFIPRHEFLEASSLEPYQLKHQILRILARIFVEFLPTLPPLEIFNLSSSSSLPHPGDHLWFRFGQLFSASGTLSRSPISLWGDSFELHSDSSQMEACIKVFAACSLIILPQAFRIILPPLIQQITLLISSKYLDSCYHLWSRLDVCD